MKVFSYGVLNRPSVQKQVWREVKEGAPDVLEGYVKKHAGKIPFLTNGDGEVEGMVYELDEQQLKDTDLYESDFYQRKKVTLKSGVKAWVYERPQ